MQKRKNGDNKTKEGEKMSTHIRSTVPYGCVYYYSKERNQCLLTKLGMNAPLPEPRLGDILLSAEYMYSFSSHNGIKGWKVKANNSRQEHYGPIFCSIAGYQIISLDDAFANCIAMVDAPEIPDGVITMKNAFDNCTSLKVPPRIPETVENLTETFKRCISLTCAPLFPKKVLSMRGTFIGCNKITLVGELPENVEDLTAAFQGCKSLTRAPLIPAKAISLMYMFGECKKLKGVICVNAQEECLIGEGFLKDVNNPIKLIGNSPFLKMLAEESEGIDVTVGI